MKAVVLVNGIPGSGKTTLSRSLAAELGFPLLAKDTVKESLFDSLGIVDQAWSRTIGVASMGVIWALVGQLPGPG
jgi:glucokinase